MNHPEVPADVAQRLLTPGAVRWLTLAELTGASDLACIDGRHAGCAVGAPGGNAGELVLMLGVLEWFAGVELDRGQVQSMLERVLAAHGRFYLHTDAQALETLGSRLVAEGVLSADEATAQRVLAFVNAPPAELRPQLALLLLEPSHIGCGHLRSLVTAAPDYRVRRALVEHVIAAFFELHWRWNAQGRNATDFVVLEGEHREQALLNLNTTSKLTDQTLVPALCALHDADYFVNHVPALRYLRQKTLALLLTSELGGSATRELEILLEVERLSERHLTLTLERLAHGLPRIRVDFDGARGQFRFAPAVTMAGSDLNPSSG